MESSPDLNWVGKLYFRPPTCATNQFDRNRKCKVRHPLSKNSLPFPLHVNDENFGFKSAQMIERLESEEGESDYFTNVIVTGDFNNDGLDDLVIGYHSETNKARQLLMNTGDGKFDSIDLPGSFHTPVNGIALGDFDGNGYLDIVLNSFEMIFNVDGKQFELRLLPRFDPEVMGRGTATGRQQ